MKSPYARELDDWWLQPQPISDRQLHDAIRKLNQSDNRVLRKLIPLPGERLGEPECPLDCPCRQGRGRQ
jgi:hypothetical protein